MHAHNTSHLRVFRVHAWRARRATKTHELISVHVQTFFLYLPTAVRFNRSMWYSFFFFVFFAFSILILVVCALDQTSNESASLSKIKCPFETLELKRPDFTSKISELLRASHLAAVKKQFRRLSLRCHPGKFLFNASTPQYYRYPVTRRQEPRGYSNGSFSGIVRS